MNINLKSYKKKYYKLKIKDRKLLKKTRKL